MGDIEIRLKKIIEGVANDISVDIIEMETDKDHVNIIAGIHPQLGVNKFVKRIKGVSSRVLRSEFPPLKTKLPTLWTNSYFVSTVGGAPLEIVKQYIENQQRSERDNEKNKWARFIVSTSNES